MKRRLAFDSTDELSTNFDSNYKRHNARNGNGISKS